MRLLTQSHGNASSADPLISVVLPVFNAEKYIGDAVRSILSQTLTDFELIVINDGSTDNTLVVLEDFKDRDNRVKLVTRANKGLVESLNEGVDLARGQWIARMDADDIALPFRFERQMQWLEQTGADITGSWTQLFGTQDRRMVKHAQTDEAIKLEMLFGSPFAHPTVMMRTELAKQLRYDKAWEKAEDYDLWERAARAGWRMTNVPEVLLLYRQHEAQISSIAVLRQEKLTQEIQRRWWEFMFGILPSSRQDIDELLKIRGQPGATLDMDRVDAIFVRLLQGIHGETRDIVLFYAFRLYLRSAASCGNVLARWRKLCNVVERVAPFGEQFSLWLLQTFRAAPEGILFIWLKKIHKVFSG